MADNKAILDVMPVMSKITDYKLSDENYLDWSKTIRLYLRSIDKENHLKEDPPKEDSIETKDQIWLRDDARLFLQIRNTIDNSVISLVNHCGFVIELMDYLEFLYSGKGNLSKMYDVCKSFYRSEKQDLSLMNYFMKFKRTFEEFNLLLPMSSDIKIQQQ